MYLKHQKKDAEGKAPIYVRVTVDGDQDDFSLSCKVLSNEWGQQKQKCTGKSQESLLINAKIAKTKGDLTTIFSRFPVRQVIKAKQLIKLYHDEDPEKEQALRKDVNYHPKVLATIDQYLELKTREKKAQKIPVFNHLLESIQQEKEEMKESIESFLQQINL
jgi:hypothetical protein